MSLLPLLLSFLVACDEGNASQENPECDNLCEVLFTECGYGAFPSFDSCLQGCIWDQSNGADIPGELRCINQAACDTFVIVECQHTYGVDDE